ncbi:raffinose/stachyose/melibiose transport system substrate-binding protein [Butyrivibrio hungatei DSM 14810]|uniref:Raffinose/stachyose/melibiose transport system substrate-binding protein n=1 Tax=Butyrivibrio hungatei DSM 14810 TaxID=1121132 RepID=A0A1M7T359_9FIRM|nr:extracellular solute-binding protein [Butyrivibrio hungatei]SHN65131.1 raffinose/stachyose/melibiose transport system substrate-binding protein [Butyrivibrio hungatei DSM 14810]
MKNWKALTLIVILVFSTIINGCAKESVEVPEEETSVEKLTLLNTKSEVTSQINDLAAKYEQETGIKIEVLGVESGANAQATLKGYYLSDQMPDIIACEASSFANWDGLLVDLSDQNWATRTDAAYKDATYGTLGFPYTTEAIGLAYNANILSACGVDPASITSPGAMRAAFEAIDAKKEELGLKAVIGYCAEPENLGWSSGNHIFGAYIDSGLDRSDTTYIDLLNNGGQVDDTRFADYAEMISLFNQYSDPDLLTAGTYNDQVLGFASGKYAFVTQGSWIGATLVGDDASEYQAAGSFPVGMVPYAFQDGMETILTSAPSWWAIPKEGQVDAAKAFLQWCSEDSAQKILVEEAGFISPFKDCKYVASDPFAKVISDYISAGKTSSWHWMDMPEGLGQKGLAFAFHKFAAGEVDTAGFVLEIKSIAKDWYSKL